MEGVLEDLHTSQGDKNYPLEYMNIDFVYWRVSQNNIARNNNHEKSISLKQHTHQNLYTEFLSNSHLNSYIALQVVASVTHISLFLLPLGIPFFPPAAG